MQRGKVRVVCFHARARAERWARERCASRAHTTHNTTHNTHQKNDTQDASGSSSSSSSSSSSPTTPVEWARVPPDVLGRVLSLLRTPDVLAILRWPMASY